MALDKITATLNETMKGVKEISDTISSFSQWVDDLLGLKDKEQNVVETTQDNIQSVKNEVENREQSPEEKRMIEVIVSYLQKVLSPKQLESFDKLFSANSIQWDVRNFLEEQMIIQQEQYNSKSNRLVALKKAYEIYDPDGSLQSVLDTIAHYYVSQSEDIRLQNTYQYTLDLVKNVKKIVPKEDSETRRITEKESTNSLPQQEWLTQNIIETAKWEVWITEFDRASDKYFRTLWYKYNTKNTPWCWAFIGWVLLKNGIQPPKNALAAKSFLGIAWEQWHVGIKVDGKVISWNYGNKVAHSTIDRPIRWYALVTPQWLEMREEKLPFSSIPEWAIVVYDRWKKDKNMA